MYQHELVCCIVHVPRLARKTTVGKEGVAPALLQHIVL